MVLGLVGALSVMAQEADGVKLPLSEKDFVGVKWTLEGALRPQFLVFNKGNTIQPFNMFCVLSEEELNRQASIVKKSGLNTISFEQKNSENKWNLNKNTINLKAAWTSNRTDKLAPESEKPTYQYSATAKSEINFYHSAGGRLTAKGSIWGESTTDGKSNPKTDEYKFVYVFIRDPSTNVSNQPNPNNAGQPGDPKIPKGPLTADESARDIIDKALADSKGNVAAAERLVQRMRHASQEASDNPALIRAQYWLKGRNGAAELGAPLANLLGYGYLTGKEWGVGFDSFTSWYDEKLPWKPAPYDPQTWEWYSNGVNNTMPIAKGVPGQ